MRQEPGQERIVPHETPIAIPCASLELFALVTMRAEEREGLFEDLDFLPILVGPSGKCELRSESNQPRTLPILISKGPMRNASP